MSDEQSTLFSRKIEANSCGACDTTQTHAHEQLLELEQNAYHWPASSNPFMRHNYGTNHWGVLPAHWHLLRAMGCPTGSYLCSALHCTLCSAHSLYGHQVSTQGMAIEDAQDRVLL